MVLVRESVVGVGVGVCVPGGGKGEETGPGRRRDAGGDPGRERGSRRKPGGRERWKQGEVRGILTGEEGTRVKNRYQDTELKSAEWRDT